MSFCHTFFSRSRHCIQGQGRGPKESLFSVLLMIPLFAGQMLAIECNPRLHSNITLMDTRREEAAEAIYCAMEAGDMNNNEDKQSIAVPDPTQKHVIWTYNELAKLLHGEGEDCPAIQYKL